MTERLNLLTVYPRDQQTCTALEASTPCKARLHWLCSFRARGVTRPLSVGTGQKTAALGYKDLPEGPSERGGGGRCSSEPDPLLSPSRHPHAPPSGQAGKNDTVWATGGCPQRLPPTSACTDASPAMGRSSAERLEQESTALAPGVQGTWLPGDGA